MEKSSWLYFSSNDNTSRQVDDANAEDTLNLTFMFSDAGNMNANNWQPPQVTQTGQTSPLAPMIAGDWVFDFTNGYPHANVSLSVVSVSEKNVASKNRYQTTHDFY